MTNRAYWTRYWMACWDVELMRWPPGVQQEVTEEEMLQMKREWVEVHVLESLRQEDKGTRC